MTPDLNTGLIIAVATAILALVTGIYLQTRQERIATAKELTKWQQSVDTTLAKHGTQLSPLWARVQDQISADLHHPDTEHSEMDHLLEKLDRLEITLAERAVLRQLLVERSHDPRVSESEQESAVMMITVMARTLTEASEAKDGNALPAKDQS